MNLSNGTDQDGDAVGSDRTPRRKRAHGSVSPLKRPHRTRGPRLAWTPRPSHRGLSTVWPCAQGEHWDGTGLLAAWLLTAVVKIVTTYTEPGQRVLLMTLPSGSRRTASGASAVGAGRSHGRPGDLYAGLREAAWTVVRLGRGIQTHTAGPTDGAASSPTIDGLPGRFGPPVRTAESDRHLGGTDPDPVDADRSDTNAPTEPASRLAADPADRFDLIITTVDPHASRRMRTWDWDRLLTVDGTLAVITHSDRRAGRLTDPTGSLVHHVQRAGLTYRDHAVLLRVPVRHSALDAAAERTTDHHRAPVRAVGTPPSVPVHSDLLVFTKPAAAAVAISAETETSDV